METVLLPMVNRLLLLSMELMEIILVVNMKKCNT